MWRTLLYVFSVVLLLGPVDNALGQTATSPAPTDKTKPTGLDADPHLVGWWKFDDASGKTAADSAKHGRNGALEGGLAFDNDSVPGRIGKALEFDGGEGFVEITGYKGVAGTQPRTVAAWIKTDRSRGEIIAWGEDDIGKMWIFGFVRDHVGVRPSGGYLYVNDRIDDDEWHHVAVAVEKGDPPNLHDSVKLYLDGTPATIHDIGLLDLWPIDTGSEMDVRIGRGFKGLIDDIRIYDRTLSEEEVKTLFRER